MKVLVERMRMMDVGPLTVEEARAVIEWLRTLWNALLEEGTEVKDEQASADADDGIVNVEPIASSSSQRSAASSHPLVSADLTPLHILAVHRRLRTYTYMVPVVLPIGM